MHLQSLTAYLHSIRSEHSGHTETEYKNVMDQQTEALARATGRPARRECLVAGCTCKDARIVSHRRAAFFAAWAKEHGETADRIVELDPTWRLTSNPSPAA
jgi:hypothetical protein